jgi:hypothetical protein
MRRDGKNNVPCSASHRKHPASAMCLLPVHGRDAGGCSLKEISSDLYLLSWSQLDALALSYTDGQAADGHDRHVTPLSLLR